MNNTSQNKIKLIVGLGNPDAQYQHTRHNMGVDLLEKLADDNRIYLNPESKFQGITGRGTIDDQDVRLLFPTTYMNESGRSVSAVCTFYRIQPEEILVLHDDLDLLPGQIRFKFGGGLAGHNGLKSICSCLGNSQNFYRLRIGIGKPPSREVINWVLGRPAAQERDCIEAAMDAAIRGIYTFFSKGAQAATNEINGFKITENK